MYLEGFSCSHPHSLLCRNCFCSCYVDGYRQIRHTSTYSCDIKHKIDRVPIKYFHNNRYDSPNNFHTYFYLASILNNSPNNCLAYQSSILIPISILFVAIRLVFWEVDVPTVILQKNVWNIQNPRHTISTSDELLIRSDTPIIYILQFLLNHL